MIDSIESIFLSIISIAMICCDLAPENVKMRCLGLAEALISEGRKSLINDLGLTFISRGKGASRPVERIQLGRFFKNFASFLSKLAANASRFCLQPRG